MKLMKSPAFFNRDGLMTHRNAEQRPVGWLLLHDGCVPGVHRGGTAHGCGMGLPFFSMARNPRNRYPWENGIYPRKMARYPWKMARYQWLGCSRPKKIGRYPWENGWRMWIF